MMAHYQTAGRRTRRVKDTPAVRRQCMFGRIVIVEGGGFFATIVHCWVGHSVPEFILGNLGHYNIVILLVIKVKRAFTTITKLSQKFNNKFLHFKFSKRCLNIRKSFRWYQKVGLNRYSKAQLYLKHKHAITNFLFFPIENSIQKLVKYEA